MASQHQQRALALFPLHAHVLPGGRLALTIFEQRYLRMVRESLKTQSGFGICMLAPYGSKEYNTHILPVGTLVRIVDFNLLSGNRLGLTVEGEQLFDIQQINTAADGLRTGYVILRDNSPDTQLKPEDMLLQQRLQEVFDTYPDLAALYPEKKYDNESWLCQRWLEILPLSAHEKQVLLANHNLQAVKQLVLQLLEQSGKLASEAKHKYL